MLLMDCSVFYQSPVDSVSAECCPDRPHRGLSLRDELFAVRKLASEGAPSPSGRRSSVVIPPVPHLTPGLLVLPPSGEGGPQAGLRL